MSVNNRVTKPVRGFDATGGDESVPVIDRVP
jgi:hypothetical protein